MKVRIVTEREFPFEDLYRWVRHCISIRIPLDEKKLKEEGFCEFDCDNGFTKAHSRYEIVGIVEVKKKPEASPDMSDIVGKLQDLHKQAITERSHFYTAKVLEEAVGEIIDLRKRQQIISEELIKRMEE